MNDQEREIIACLLERGYNADELKQGMDGYRFPPESVDRAVDIIEAHPRATTAEECS